MTTLNIQNFPKDDLLELLDYSKGEGFCGYEMISDKILENTRWSIVHQIIFKHGEQFWRTTYRVGATEYQDERPWEHDGDQVSCTEVVPVEKTIIVYEVKRS
jgi:hypothetical protein